MQQYNMGWSALVRCGIDEVDEKLIVLFAVDLAEKMLHMDSVGGALHNAFGFIATNDKQLSFA
jgi:hypothetical protein